MGRLFGGDDLAGQGGGFFGLAPKKVVTPPAGSVYTMAGGISQGSGPDPNAGGEGFGWMDGGTNGSPIGATFNLTSGSPILGTPSVMCGVTDVAGFGASFGVSPEPPYTHYCLAVYGVQLQTLFTTINFPTAQFAGNHTYASASAFFNNTYTFNGQSFTVWMWATTDHDINTYFNGMTSSDVLVTVT